MAVTAGMDFSTLVRAPGATAQSGSADEGVSPVAAPAQVGTQGDSFDNLMNFLLDASGAPEGADVVEGGPHVIPSPEIPADMLVSRAEAADPAGDAFFDIDRLIPDLPASTEALLPPDGKVLPVVDSAPVVADEAMIAEETPDGDDSLACAGDVPVMSPVVSLDEPVESTDGEMPRVTVKDPEDPVAPPAGLVPAPVAVVAEDNDVPVVAASPPAQGPAVTAPASGSGSTTSQASSAVLPAAPMAPETGAARDATAPRPDAAARMEPMASSPVHTDRPSSDGGSEQAGNPDGGTRLQELLARFGSADGASAARGDGVQALARDPDGAVPTNSGALTYAQTGASVQPREAPVSGPALHTPLRHPEWNEELGQRIRWAIGNQIQTAELKINPPQLGPIEVRVSMDADRQLSVTLSSQHALVRETLQDSLPRLRDLMSEQGFGAVNVDVSQHSPSDGGRTPARQAGTESPSRAEAAPAEAMDPGAGRPREVRGLVDLYA